MKALRKNGTMHCNSCNVVGNIEETFYKCSCCNEVFCVLCYYELKEHGLSGDTCPSCIEEVYMVDFMIKEAV